VSTARDPQSELERQVHLVLRSLPQRRAPEQLTARVLEELARRAALPWWRRSFRHWPWLMRSVFLAVCLGLIGASVLGVAGVSAHVPGLAGAVRGAAQLHVAGGIGQIATALHAALASLSALVRALPATWLEAIALIAGAAYVLLFGLGAAAYRLLTVQHRATTGN
jgi:hypothetical protein